MAVTSVPGDPDNQPGNVVPGAAGGGGGGGGGFVRTVNLTGATLGFSGYMTSGLSGRLLYAAALTVVTQLRKLVSAQHRPMAVVQSRFIVLKVVQRTTSQLDSVPFPIDMAVTETFPYQVDVTNYLASGDTITAITAVLTLESSGAPITSAWQGSISTAGNIIQVPINCPVLQLGQSYQLATTFTASSGKRLTILSLITIVA